jgi:hypothetical protein
MLPFINTYFLANFSLKGNFTKKSKFLCAGLQGVALKYEEEFHQALSSFARAQVSHWEILPA